MTERLGDQEMTKLGLAIIGLGMASGHHAKALLDLAGKADVIAAFSPTEARRRAFSETYGFPVTDSLSQIFENDAIGAVLILTPPNTHLELVRQAAKAGKHILLEKPLDISLLRAEAIVKTAGDAEVNLSIVLQNRFRSSFRTLQHCLEEGRLGSILEASASIRNWRAQSYYDEPGRGTLARDGGGVLLTQAIHTIDLLLSLAGTPVDVSSFIRTTSIHRMETEDLVSASVAFENGAVGTLSATTCAYPGFSERIELICTGGTAVLLGDRLDVAFHDGSTLVAGANMDAGVGHDPMAFGYELHRALIEDFIDSVSEKRSPVVTGTDALRAHAFIEKILRSSR